MNVLVTGGSGFIGKHLIKRLVSDDYHVLAPNRDEFNITDEKSVDDYLRSCGNIDALVHLASNINFADKQKSFYENIYGAHLLFEKACWKNILFMVYSSSNNAYGTHYCRKVTEADALNPSLCNDYAITKYINELDLLKQAEQGSFKACIVRISDVYGYGASQGNMLKAFVNNAVRGLPLQIYGEGKRTRDYIAVEDVAAGISLLLKKQAAGIYNLSTGIGTSIAELAAVFADLSEGRSVIEHKITDNEDISTIVLDNAKIAEVGFKASIDVKGGMRKLFDDKVAEGDICLKN